MQKNLIHLFKSPPAMDPMNRADIETADLMQTCTMDTSLISAPLDTWHFILNRLIISVSLNTDNDTKVTFHSTMFHKLGYSRYRF